MKRIVNSVFYHLFRHPYYKLVLGQLGSRSRLIKPQLSSPRNIFIGQRVYIRSNTWLAAVPLSQSGECRLEIGDGTYVGNNCHFYATKKIKIGKKVLIADKVYLADNLHSFSDIHTPIIDQPIKQIAPVVIEDGAWLGENVCIIGATIGKNAVIGANAVVTKDIPDYCVAAGIPARIIKRYNFETGLWQSTNQNGNFI